MSSESMEILVKMAICSCTICPSVRHGLRNEFQMWVKT